MTSSTPVLLPQLGLEVTEGRVNAVLVEVGAQVRAGPAAGRARDRQGGHRRRRARRRRRRSRSRSRRATPSPSAPCSCARRRRRRRAGAGRPRRAPSGARRPPAAPSRAGAGRRRRRRRPRDAAAPRVAPVARRAAAKLGVDLEAVTGTGPRGRITLYDVEGAAATQRAAAARAADGREELTATRRAIARRMTASQLIPQYHLVRDVDATHLLAEKDAQASPRRREGRRQRPADPGDRGDGRPPPAARHRLCRRRPAVPAAPRVDRRRARRRDRPRARRPGHPGRARAGAGRHRVGPQAARRGRPLRPPLAGRDDRRRDHALQPRRARRRSLHRDGQPRREHDRRRRAHGRAARAARPRRSPSCRP